MSLREATLPVLDVRTLRGADAAQFVAALGEAFQRYGFVSVVGHAVDSTLTEPLYAAARELFALPLAEKQRYVVPGSGGARGYTPFGIETAKDQTAPDLKEFWHVGRELDHAPMLPGLLPNVWPAEVPRFESAALALWRALDALGHELLSAVARFLALPPSWFEGAIDHGNSILRPLHYPALPATVEGVRSAAHEDINLITLLVGSGEPGLEILLRDGSWLPVETAPGQVVVNVGDMLQRLTNHALISTTHRVVNPPAPWGTRARYSVPFFLHPNPEFLIRTLPSCVSVEQPDRYPDTICADDYLKQRLREIGLL